MERGRGREGRKGERDDDIHRSKIRGEIHVGGVR